MIAEARAAGCLVCGDPELHARGKCVNCYHRDRYREKQGLAVAVPTLPSTRTPKPKKGCLVPGCPVAGNVGRGYCGRHYAQWRRGALEKTYTPPSFVPTRNVTPAQTASARADKLADACWRRARLQETYDHCEMPVAQRVAFRRRLRELNREIEALGGEGGARGDDRPKRRRRLDERPADQYPAQPQAHAPGQACDRLPVQGLRAASRDGEGRADAQAAEVGAAAGQAGALEPADVGTAAAVRAVL